MAKEKIKVRMFFELMGWPKEALNENLKKIIKKLKDREKWEVLTEDYSEPEKIGEKMFTSHVEFESKVSDVLDLFAVTLAYGPSVVEILEPHEVFITGNQLQDVLADVSSKVAMMDRDIKVLAARIKRAQKVIEKLKNGEKKEKEAQNKENDKSSKFTIKK